MARTTLRIAIFLSEGNSSRIASNSVCSSASSAGAAAPPAPGIPIGIIMPPAGAAALTPKASSICETNSDASSKERDLSCSRISSVFADISNLLFFVSLQLFFLLEF